MAPDEVLRSFLDMEQRGWRLGGIVHSHPVGQATPSQTDLREFQYPEALMVIACPNANSAIRQETTIAVLAHGLNRE